MNAVLVLSVTLSLALGSWGDDNAELLDSLKATEEDKCAFTLCETPNWKQDNCCDGFVCIMPEIFDPVQKPRCVNKKFLPGFGYNFGYESLGLDSDQSLP